MITPEDIQDAYNKLERMYEDYLRQHGWEYRCDYPGALWLWSKGELKGVSTKNAFGIQQAMDI